MSGSEGPVQDPAPQRAGTDPTDLVEHLLFEMEQAEIDLPHIVLSRQAATGDISCSGPYPDGISALRAAELEHTIEVDAGGQGEITFHVAALYPPLDIARAGRG
jgi:hypothetical protein